ncbi:ferric reductase-like transmembrane domain-containing protein [Actinorugispora endophytica]|uniref:Putative ferric reductase n=1 Tax=Actinorugispora endophytica TaxID=1605990 RepID=A0A4R6UER2_9ACTN|nr:ferric reductase-like transmembrane domain-containing protein [Actinorugispora endophytica]TDQ43649.1 putative ferric reductase [Actinorugispora endophytica]
MSHREHTIVRPEAEAPHRPLRVSPVVAAVVASALPFLLLVGRFDEVGGTVPGLANLTGFVGALLIWWQVLLGVRQVSALATPDRGAVVGLHAWLGASGAFFVLLHPLLEMVSERQDLLYLVRFDFTWVESSYTSLGRAALLLFLALWLSSTLARAAVRYRVWRYTHYLSYPMAVLVFLHSYELGTFLLETPWLRWYWLALAWSFAAVCAWRLAGPLLSARYRLVRAHRVSDTVTLYTLAPLGRRLRPRPGQFCHLRTGLLAPSHPFSVVESREPGGVLAFAVRNAGPFTGRLAGLAPGATVYLDGPYGTFTAEAGTDGRPSVLVAGGIGVTPFTGLVRSRPADGTWLFHVTRAAGDALFADELRARLGARYVNAVSDPASGGAPFDAREIVRRLGPRAARRARYFVCGSPGFVAHLTGSLLDQGVTADQLHIERFEW